MKITACQADQSGCGFYRIMLPYEVLRRRGHDVHVTGDLFWNRYTYEPRIPADVIVVQRPGNAGSSGLFEIRKRWGTPIVAEIDDLLWAIPRSNPAWWVWHTRKRNNFRIEDVKDNDGRVLGQVARADKGYSNKQTESIYALRQFMSQADAITVSTEPLAEECRRLWPKVPVYLLPNCTASGDWPVIDRQKAWQETGQVTLGWGGSHTHKADLSLITGLPGQVMAGHPEARLYLFGGYREARNTLAKGIEDSRIEEAGWRQEPWKTMPGLVAPIDIGLAPVEDTRFNHSKSDLKALEYGLACTPTIASDTVTYRTFIRHGENGFLCKTPADWMRAMEILVTDHARRIEMGKRARADAEARDIDNYVSLWETALTEVIERAHAGVRA